MTSTPNRLISMAEFERDVVPQLRQLTLSETKLELLRAFSVGILGWDDSVSPILKTILGYDVMYQLYRLRPELEPNRHSESFTPYVDSFRGEMGNRSDASNVHEYDSIVIWETNKALCDLFEVNATSYNMINWSNGIRCALFEYVKDNPEYSWPPNNTGVLQRFLRGLQHSHTPTPTRVEPESFPEFIV